VLGDYLTRKLADITRYNYKKMNKLYLAPLHSTPLVKITPEQIRTVMNDYTQSCRNQSLTLLISLYNFAKYRYRPNGEEIFSSNPAQLASKIWDLKQPMERRTGRIYPQRGVNNKSY
jgi:hypothetical protein